MNLNAVSISLFLNRIRAICDEMGVVLRQSAFSPNIRDRLDFSCAIFDSQGNLSAQAAHIPVHLGSMSYAMTSIVNQFQWQEGDCLILNDPYLGGTHLPDITLITPVFFENRLCAFVANRAHHADIGADTPGSMPISSHLDEEGLLIPPTLIIEAGELQKQKFNQLLQQLNSPEPARADLLAQISANQTACKRLSALLGTMGHTSFRDGLTAINAYSEKLARNTLKDLPDGCYEFTDYMDDDGQGQLDLTIKLKLTIKEDSAHLDFTGTSAQSAGNINCPLSVTAAAVYYVFYALMPAQTPATAGSFKPITIHAPAGSLLNAIKPAAVAAGNVETSSRIVDVVMGALAQAIPTRLPAASQGTMNNIAMGCVDKNGNGWDYYETLAGGMGASQNANGLDAVQSHMTNTLNTPIEVLEMHYPLRIRQYQVRKDSGGAGKHKGGDGVIREYEFLTDNVQVSLLSERRQHAPWGSEGGEPGQTGRNLLNDQLIAGKLSIQINKGDRLTIETPGGGGWGLKNTN